MRPRFALARDRHGAATEADRWKKVGEEGHVIFVNIDGEPVALKWIQDGYMDCCVSQ